MYSKLGTDSMYRFEGSCMGLYEYTNMYQYIFGEQTYTLVFSHILSVVIHIFIKSKYSTPSYINFKPTTPSYINYKPKIPSYINYKTSAPSNINYKPSAPSYINFKTSTPSFINPKPSIPSYIYQLFYPLSASTNHQHENSHPISNDKQGPHSKS
uniref:Uncharacterized protein n=1 Tax=Arion vulgaris TaxID=1028688 RepID=A0A0B7ABF8_9EUPU